MIPNDITRLPAGLYVLKTAKDNVISRIDSLSQPFYKQLSDKQAVATCYKCSHDICELLEDCFADTCARNKSIKLIHSCYSDDINLARLFGQRMLQFMCKLKESIYYFVPLRDFPSCKSLLDFSSEDILEKATDLIGSGIIKAFTNMFAIGSDVYKIVNIADVKRFYSDALKTYELDSDRCMTLTPLDIVFENKSKMELEYCRMALLKSSGKLTKAIMDESRLLIDGYQRKIESLSFPVSQSN